MVTHRGIKKLEDIQNILKDIVNGNIDNDAINKSVKTVNELMELYYEAFVISGMTSEQSWGARDENNEMIVNNYRLTAPQRSDYVCWKCSNKEYEKDIFKGLIR